MVKIITCLLALLLSAGVASGQEASRKAEARTDVVQAKSGSPASPGNLFKIRSPILSQVMMFVLPKGFKTAFQDTDEKKFTQEFILDGESVDKWSQMIMAVAYKGLSSSPLASPEQHVTAVGNLFRRNCPDAYSGASLGKSRIDGFDAYAAIMSCGLVKPEDPYSETTLFIVIKGDKDFYTLQWSVRGMAVNRPIRFDQARWQARMDSLAPIKLCSDRAGEFPLYPDCF